MRSNRISREWEKSTAIAAEWWATVLTGKGKTKQTKNLCGNNALCWWNPRTRQPYLGAVSVARPAFGPWKTSSYPLHSSILLHFLFDAVKAMAYEPIPLFWFKRERECECGVRACARMIYVVRVLCMLSECVDGRASVSNARMNVKTIEFQLNQLWDAHKHTRQKRKTSLRIVCPCVWHDIAVGVWCASVCPCDPNARNDAEAKKSKQTFKTNEMWAGKGSYNGASCMANRTWWWLVGANLHIYVFFFGRFSSSFDFELLFMPTPCIAMTC